MTLMQTARLALEVQEATNLSGVVHEFAAATDVLWMEARRQEKGAEFVNLHPISVLFTYKMAALAGNTVFFLHQYEDAYKACEQLAHPSRAA